MPLTLDNVQFSYRKSGLIFDGLDLTFDHVATVVLGPNGAGKSTLLSLAATALRPRSGSISLDGIDPSRRSGQRAFRRLVGWIPQQAVAVPGLRVREQVAYCGWLKGMSRTEAWDASLPALQRVQLGSLADRPSGRLSGGQMRRMAIAQALVHGSRFLLMDEPTAGLDPTQRQIFRDLAADLCETTSIVVSTHQTEDLSQLYDRVVLLADGQVRHDGDLASFLHDIPADAPEAQRIESAYARYVSREA